MFILFYNCSLIFRAGIDPFLIEETSPPSRRRPVTAFALLMRLDNDNGGGLTEAEFKGLFWRCHSCHNYATKRSFQEHVCSVDAMIHEVIDLTGDD